MREALLPKQVDIHVLNSAFNKYFLFVFLKMIPQTDLAFIEDVFIFLNSQAILLMKPRSFSDY